MGENTLFVAPLSVARQTTREAVKLGLGVRYVRGQGQVTGEHKLWITNYEMAESFDPAEFGAVVLDESSILKNVDGKMRAPRQWELSARFVEWMMGLPNGWVTDSGIPRNAQLKALGNGIVPQQMALALRLLLDDEAVVA